ncbi:MAG: DUF1003 domain-containing protein [Chitinophagaceae bacterium]|nr:DUF1003 domain-containing protein [Chitinophagaceae bacterium]
MKQELKHLMQSQHEQLEKLRTIVQETMRKEELMTDNLQHPPKEILSRGEMISDKVARFGGSWSFIISFFLVLVIWIILNSVVLSNKFDPYPFILMNLILSCIAALQAPVIMMSQNRQEEKDRKRSENDYLINLKAELEIQALHGKMDLLIQEQFKLLFESQAQQLQLMQKILHHQENASQLKRN